MADSQGIAVPVMDRRTLLKAGGVGAAALAMGVVTAKPADAASTFDLDVEADGGLLEVVATANGGPFYVPGLIFAPGTSNQIGDFHCWGFFYNAGLSSGGGSSEAGDAGVVAQEYNLFGKGKIQVQGVEDEGPRAVTGGTGNFRNTRGEMTGADLSGFPNFTVTFRLIG
jgi:hypothetical protein